MRSEIKEEVIEEEEDEIEEVPPVEATASADQKKEEQVEEVKEQPVTNNENQSVPNSLIQSYFPNNNRVKPVEGSYTQEELIAQNRATNSENKDQ